MLISHSRSFRLFRNLLIISVFVICLVFIFHISGNSVQFRNYFILNNNASRSSAYYQQLSNKTDLPTFAQRSTGEGIDTNVIIVDFVKSAVELV